MIKHEECGAIFALSSNIFPERTGLSILQCPNCGTELLKKENFNKLTRVLKEYRRVSKLLKVVNATIREIQLEDLEFLTEKEGAG